MSDMTWPQLFERLTRGGFQLEVRVEFRPAKCRPTLPPIADAIDTTGTELAEVVPLRKVS